MRFRAAFVALILLFGCTANAAESLRVSDDGRSLVTANGQPFFWQGDTAWELFARLNREDALAYLNDRAQRRFNVIQASAISAFTGAGPNAHGDRACDGTVERLILTPGKDPAEAEQYDYWDHVEFIVDEAGKSGMQVSLTAVWQNQIKLDGDARPVNAANAEAYGRFLGERFGKKTNVLWQVVGDAPEVMQTDPRWREVWRSLARGIAVGATGGEHYNRVLISFHPAGPGVSSRHFATEPWLAFHSAQSGHNKDQAHPHALIEQAYRAQPTRPVIDYEPPYDDLLRDDQHDHGRNDDADARKSAYWSTFAGALGHTYGHAALFQMWHAGIKGWDGVQIDWRAALKAPGGADMRHLQALLASRPTAGRRPDQDLLTEPRSGAGHLRAFRGDGFALIYSPLGAPFTVATDRLNGDRITATWFDPREGTTRVSDSFVREATRAFTPPTHGRGQDWVLILDDSARNFSPPHRSRL